MKKEEIKSFRKFLNLHEEGSDGNKLKSVILLEAILDETDHSLLDEKVLCEKLYGDAGDKSHRTFQKLLLRFKDKLYETLLLDLNLFRKDSYDELTIALSEVRKFLLLVNILRFRTSDEEMERLFDRIITKSKQYELYDELIQALELKLSFLGYRIGYDEVSYIRKDIEFFERCRRSLRTAKEWYTKLGKDESVTPENTSYLRYLQHGVEELEHEYRYTQSLNIAYYLYLVSLEYCQKTGDYEKGRSVSLQLIELLETNQSVYLDQRMGTAYLNYANNEIYLLNFSEGLKFADKAIALFPENGINYNLCLDTKAYCHFYSGELGEAEEILQGILQDPASKQTSLQKAKRNYMLANINFLRKNYAQTNKLLQELNELEKDQVDWNNGVRILNLMIQLEQEKYDLVDSRLENFRKYQERVSKSEDVKKRDRIILKVLLDLSRNAFDFSTVWVKDEEQFRMLFSEKPESGWQPNGPEMVVFHQWFIKMIRGEYDANCLNHERSYPMKMVTSAVYNS
ncbi:MAG: hypothetical protein HKN22_00210 [Bacteroidia bacterium]|nr:hypothetical protein [Bacteroidia bacterium]